jgi:hypothetical protein
MQSKPSSWGVLLKLAGPASTVIELVYWGDLNMSEICCEAPGKAPGCKKPGFLLGNRASVSR